jgi:dienelactone hydrolase
VSEKVIMCLGALLLAVSSTAASAQAVISQPAGTYAVGLRVVQQYDHSREFKGAVDPVTGQTVSGERSRPIQTLIWYPASRVGAPLRYRDYAATRLTEVDFDLTGPRLKALAADQAAGIAADLGDEAPAALDAPMLASRDAPMASGKFPVVIYAPGAGGAADENADLAEYLAGNGYVVIASTNMGARGKQNDYSPKGAEPQIADIEFLLGYAQSLPDADMAHVAVMGWSWGGMNNVLAAARDSRIGALISLDGTREPAITKQIDVRRLTAPWLYMSRIPSTIPQLNRSEVDTSFSLLNAAKYADVYQLTMYPMRHGDFTSRMQRESDGSAYGEYSKTEVRHTYNVAALYIRNFLDAYLKHEKNGLAFLRRSPLQNGAAPHTIFAETHQAEAAPASQEQLAVKLARDGFGHATEAYQAARQQDPSFALSEEELKAWGYALMEQKRPADASAIFKLWTTLHSQDWDAFDSLGEAYEAAGDRRASIESYRRSLALNAGNTNAVKRLKALGEAR